MVAAPGHEIISVRDMPIKTRADLCRSDRLGGHIGPCGEEWFGRDLEGCDPTTPPTGAATPPVIPALAVFQSEPVAMA
jgi:hypothetical protein